jgi:cytosine/adenosine deaminase-related metal-dependent hydrolase
VIGTEIDGENKLLLPGFINAHTHSSEQSQLGIIPPLPLEL